LITLLGNRSCVIFLAFWKIATALAESPALVRDATVTTVQTLQGSVPAHVTAVAPSRDVTVIVLADTLAGDDAALIRREIAATFTPAFLGSHRLQLASVSGAGGDFSTPLFTAAQLLAALKQVTAGKTESNTAALIEILGDAGQPAG
jgi:hypothetical protein